MFSVIQNFIQKFKKNLRYFYVNLLAYTNYKNAVLRLKIKKKTDTLEYKFIIHVFEFISSYLNLLVLMLIIFKILRMNGIDLYGIEIYFGELMIFFIFLVRSFFRLSLIKDVIKTFELPKDSNSYIFYILLFLDFIFNFFILLISFCNFVIIFDYCFSIFNKAYYSGVESTNFTNDDSNDV